VIRRRHFLFAASVLGLAKPSRAAQTLTVLIGAETGSATDMLARVCLPFLARHLKLATIGLHNIPGEAGLAAAQTLAQASPTGTTLGWAVTPTLPARMVDHGGGNLMQRILLLGAVQREPIVFVAPPATRLDSVQDIIERAAGNAASVRLGTPPPGSAPHLAALRLQALTGTSLNIVAFPSADAVRQAAASGKVAAATLGLSNAIGDLRNGRVVGLGIADDNRAELFPDMPPVRDCGIDLTAVIRRGLAAPAGLPDETAAQLRKALEAVAIDSDFSVQAGNSGFLATWIDGRDWTAEASAERTELAGIWATEPWLGGTSG
jgi:tripartite-type tricarboxylate transporter receptor subunit TctC